MDSFFIKKAGADGIDRTALTDAARESLRAKLKTTSDIEIRQRFSISKNLLQKYYLYPGDGPVTAKGQKAVESLLRGETEDTAPMHKGLMGKQTLQELVLVLKANGVREVTLRF